MSYKLGRLAPLWSPAHMKAAHRMSARIGVLGAPPSQSADFVKPVTAHVGKDWGMLGNDTLGDCTAADGGHTLMLRTANTGHWLEPSEADVVSVYEQYGGYRPGDPSTDQGAQEADVCAFMKSIGLLGHRSQAYAPVATGVIDGPACNRIRWAIQLYGSCRLGVNLPNSAQDQFSAGTPWAISGDLTIEGGHDVPAVKYDQTYLYVVTWGALQAVEWSWLERFGDEAWAELYPDFLRSTGLSPAGYDQTALLSDLAELQI